MKIHVVGTGIIIELEEKEGLKITTPGNVGKAGVSIESHGNHLKLYADPGIVSRIAPKEITDKVADW